MEIGTLDKHYGISVGKTKIDLLDVSWLLCLCLFFTHYSIPKIPMISILLVFFLSVINILLKQYPLQNIVRNSFFLPYFVFTAWVILSNAWSLFGKVGADIESESIRLLVILFCLNYYVTSREKLYKMMLLVIVAATYFSLVYLISSPVSTYGTTGMGGITDIWRNTASYMGGAVGLMAFYLSSQQNDKRRKLFLIICGIICVSLLVVTGSRKGVIQLALYACAFILVQPRIGRKIKWCVGIFIVFIIAFQILRNLPFFKHAYMQRLLGLFDASADDGSIAERNYFRDVALFLFNKSPLIGCGMDSVRSYLENTGFFHVTYSHSNILEIMACYGLIGVVLYYWYIIISTFRTWRNRKQDGFYRLVFVLLITMIVCDYGMVSYYIRQFVLITAVWLRGIEIIGREKSLNINERNAVME